VWQFFAGVWFLLFIVVVLLRQPFERAAGWRGASITLLGFFLMFALVLGSGSVLDPPAKELWNVLQHGYGHSPPTFEQKFAAGAAALALPPEIRNLKWGLGSGEWEVSGR
jgi:hypothetical protein